MKIAFLEKKEVPNAINAEVIRKVVRRTITYNSETWTAADKYN